MVSLGLVTKSRLDVSVDYPHILLHTYLFPHTEKKG